MGKLTLKSRHRLLIDDCTVKENVERLMNGERAVLVITDPPYGISYQSNYRKKKFEVITNDELILDQWIDGALKYSDGWIVFFFGWQRAAEWLSVGKQIGKITNILIWKKASAMGDLTGQFSPNFELALAFSRGAKLREGNRPSAIFEVNTDSTMQFEHPTQKPVALISQILDALPDGLVLDPFLGSGTTLIACQKTNRRCFGMEIDPLYCDVILTRYAKFASKDAVREDGVTWSELLLEESTP